MTRNISGGTGNGNGDNNDNIIHLPATEAERRQMRKLLRAQVRQRLVDVFIGEDGRQLFHDPNGVAYADPIIGGHRETWLVKSKEFRSALIGHLRRLHDRLVSEQSILAFEIKAAMTKRAVNAQIDDFETRAIGSTSAVRTVCVRVAEHEGSIYIDLCNPNWEAIRVNAGGWYIIADPPVRFRRTRGMLELPHPERGGKLEMLRPFLNVKTDADFIMCVAWTLAAMRAHGPYTILNLYGEHGSAKTHLLQFLRSLFDPHTTATTRLPFGSRDLYIAARNSHAQMFANVSSISDAMSDDLCRLATGEGMRTRELFTDSGEALFGGERPIAIEGINRSVIKPDLLSRSAVLEIPPLSGYLTAHALRARFEAQRAKIFGALLDTMVRGLAALPTVQLINPPRMADFAEWGVACGLPDFEAVYAANRREAISVMLDHDLLARALREFMTRRKQWRGIAEELLTAIGPAAKVGSTQSLSDQLRRLAPALRTVGLNVVHEPRKNQRRPLLIEKVTPVTIPL